MKNIFKIISIGIAILICIISIMLITFSVNSFTTYTTLTTSVTSRFFLKEPYAPGANFAMVSARGDIIIYITDDVPIYFEDYVPLSDDCDNVTKHVRDLLFGRTLAEVLEGRNMKVIINEHYLDSDDQIKPISIEVLFEAIAN